MRSTVFVAASLACFSCVSAAFSYPGGYPSNYPSNDQSFNCANTDATISVSVANDINCQDNQGTAPYPNPYPNQYPGYNPYVTAGQGSQDVNCLNSEGVVVVSVGNSETCQANQANSGSYPGGYPSGYPSGYPGSYPNWYPFQAKAAKDEKKADHKS